MTPCERVDRRVKRRIVAAGVLSLTAWPVMQASTPRGEIVLSSVMLEAGARMKQAIGAIAGFCDSAGIEIEETLDPNRTCLVGPEYTPLFTTLGQLEAKRTTMNPDMAGLIVHLLELAGVKSGDTIAVGASASFPALLVATLAAAEALGVRPVTILSLGASSYGATRPELNLLDIHELLLDKGIVSTAPAAVSLGGEHDVGGEFDDVVRQSLQRSIVARGRRLLGEPDLRRNVAERMSVYFDSEAGGRPSVAAFVNIGGSDANIGVSPRVLEVQPGLNMELALPPSEQRGVLYEMSARGVPVIHLLNVRELALRHGLPWDPIPLPEPGETRMYGKRSRVSVGSWLVSAVYLTGLCLVGLVGRQRVRPTAGTS